MWCAVVRGLPFLGNALELTNPSFDVEALFKKHGEYFMVDLGPAGGMHLATRSPEDMRCRNVLL